MKESILVENLAKSYYQKKKSDPGISSKLKNFFSPKYDKFIAVNNISFKINPGERVAFIGPNGAGKSTTIKMLTGITKPDYGNIKILGLDPIKNRKKNCYKIGALFGNIFQLWEDISIYDSFKLLGTIYDLPQTILKKRITFVTENFKIESFLYKTLRELSLGQKMKCELAACFLHNPQVLFLDEPTIGLDISAKTNIRDLITNIIKKENKTLILTSHDTDDIEKVCNRVIIMNKGSIVYDNTLKDLKSKIKKKLITIITEEKNIKFELEGAKIIESSFHKHKIEIDLSKINYTKDVINYLINKFEIKDLVIENPPLEDIISTFYQQK